MAVNPAPTTGPVVPPVLTPPAANPPKRARAPKGVATTPPTGGSPPVAVKPSSDSFNFVPIIVLAAFLVVAIFVLIGLTSMQASHDKEMAEVRSSVTAKEAELAARDAEVAAKEAKLAAIEEAKKKNVEVIDVEEDGTIHIKRHQTIGPLPVQQFGVCEEGEIPLIMPISVEAPQAQAPAKPKADDWPTVTIEGTVEKPQPPAKKSRPLPDRSFTRQPSTPRVEKCWVFRGRDQFGCEVWEQVPVAHPMSASRMMPARDIRYRSTNYYQMR